MTYSLVTYFVRIKCLRTVKGILWHKEDMNGRPNSLHYIFHVKAHLTDIKHSLCYRASPGENVILDRFVYLVGFFMLCKGEAVFYTII